MPGAWGVEDEQAQGYLTQVTLRPAYLTKKLAYPLPTKDREVLRTIRDVHDYLLALTLQRGTPQPLATRL